MTAQSQEAAAKKAVMLGNASSYKILARLWQSSAAHFSSALKFWYAPNAKKLRENVQESVPHLIDQKFRLSSAFTLYFAAQWSYTEERVGEAISRCTAAMKICDEAGNEGVLSRQFSILKDDILTEYSAKLEKENGLIFHEPVPAVLPEVEPASLVNTLSVDQVFGFTDDDRDLFSGTVPKHLKQVLEKYKEETDKLISYEQHLVETIRKEAQIVTHDLNCLALFGSPKKYLETSLQETVRNEAIEAIKDEPASELSNRGARLKEILKSEIRTHLGSLQTISKDLFDIQSLKAEDRRAFLEKADTLAAVFESIEQQIDQVANIEFDKRLESLEVKVKEYAEGRFGDIKAIEEDKASDNDEKEAKEPEILLDAIEINNAIAALQSLKDKVSSEGNIADDFVKAGKHAYDENIKKHLKKFDPLASKIEDAVKKAKAEIDRAREVVESKKSKAQSKAAFKFAEDEVDKRKTLVNVYKGELLKIRYSHPHTRL
jgi:hypothetical protein